MGPVHRVQISNNFVRNLSLPVHEYERTCTYANSKMKASVQLKEYATANDVNMTFFSRNDVLYTLWGPPFGFPRVLRIVPFLKVMAKS